MSKKIVATVEARMNSSRLPGKVLLPAAGEPMLWHLVNRLRHVTLLDEIVLATSTNSSDDALFQFATDRQLTVFRGSEEDVLERVLNAAKSVNADIIVEITGDCPLIDPGVIEQVLLMHLHNQAAYTSNVIVRSYPIGMDVQVFSLDALARSAKCTSDKNDREHVSLYMRNNPEEFSPLHVVASPEQYWPELRLTLDTEEDYALLKRILEHATQTDKIGSCAQIIQLLRQNPTWVQVNAEIKQRVFTDWIDAYQWNTKAN